MKTDMAICQAVIALLLCAASGILLAEPAALGRALYLGHLPWHRGEAATTAGLPPDLSACARCHGATGQGSQEGGQRAPALDSGRLYRSDGPQPAFANDQSVLAAIENGVGRGGRTLSAVMPRFRLSPEERRALIAHLHRLGTSADLPPGVDAHRIRIGVPIPEQRNDPVASEIRKGINETVASANATGGVHGRRLELVFVTLHEIEKLMVDQPIFAMTGGWLGSGGADGMPEALEALQRKFRVAHIASLTPAKETATLDSGWTAHLLPSTQEMHAAQSEATRQACPEVEKQINAADRVAWEHLHLAVPAPTREFAAARVVLAGKVTTQDLLEHQASLPFQGHSCLDSLPFWQESAKTLPPGRRIAAVLPFPTAIIPYSAAAGRSPWETLGHIVGTVLIEALAEAGPILHERSLLEALPAVNGRELESGLRLSFTSSRMHGFSPEILESKLAPSASSMPASALNALHSSLGD